MEFVPEFTADVGIKKGEKVDYAILKDGKPLILIEAKWCNEELNKHDSQLFRYFAATSAKFGILTNGIIYKFYTDLEEPNKMDEKPFLEINLLDIKDSWVGELKKFQKSVLNVDDILNTASDLKYSNQIKSLLAKQLMEPDENFVSYILGEIYEGKKTKAVIDRFKSIVKKSYNQFLSETMNDRIKAAIGQSSEEVNPEEPEEPVTKIITTHEELEYFFTIKTILHKVISPSRVFYRDTESYLGILIDNNKLKWVCRVALGTNQKSLIIPDENKKPIRYPIESIDSIYDLQDKIIESAKRFI